MKKNRMLNVMICAVLLSFVINSTIEAINWIQLRHSAANVVGDIGSSLNYYRKKFLDFILQRDDEATRIHKTMIMGTANYSEMLNKMKYFMSYANRQDISNFMRTFVFNYIKNDEKSQKLVYKEYVLFNEALEALRKNNVSWLEIAGIQNAHSVRDLTISMNAWELLSRLKDFNARWANDASLNQAIAVLENKIVQIR